MPTYDAFCRAPLVNPVLVALPDSAVRVGGLHERLTRAALQSVALNAISPLDAVLATKLGGYEELPAPPDLRAWEAHLSDQPRGFVEAVRAAVMLAAAARDKDAMLGALDAMRAFEESMSSMPEEVLMTLGADALRVCGEMYRRTGQKFLLAIMERCRAQLPDVSGMFHSFPFLRAFAPEKTDPAATDETSLYYRRMERLGTGALTADALAITASLALYSGSARDASASKAGVSALQRYHGLPNGAFSADPYLSGRDPSRSSDLYAVCAYAEALYDLLAASGDLSFAEKLEVLTQNALANFFAEDGVRASQSVNRLADDPTSIAAAPAPAQTSALLRALYAVRRAVWMVKAEDELCMLLPYDGCCLTRMDGVPVRITAETKGFGEIELSVEARKPVTFALSLRIPSWSDGASVGVNGGKPQHADANTLFTLRREFKTGDTVQLHLPCEARVETGFRGSASVFCGPVLMALPLPETNAAWQYALDSGVMPKLEIADGRPLARVDACDAMDWTARQGVIAPPPQGLRMGAGYELTLLPYAETAGRIAAFPQAGNRE